MGSIIYREHDNIKIFFCENRAYSQDNLLFKLEIKIPDNIKDEFKIFCSKAAIKFTINAFKDIKYDDKLEKILTSETYREYNRNNTSDSLVNNYLQNTYMQKYKSTYLI